MRSLLFGLLLSALLCFSQPAPGKLAATLAALGDPGRSDAGLTRSVLTRQLVDEMMSLSNARVSRTSVESFVDLFTNATINRAITRDQVVALQNCITDALRGTTPNSNSSKRLREVLTAIHVDALNTRAIVKYFIAIGEEVRGPDDVPVAFIGK